MKPLQIFFFDFPELTVCVWRGEGVKNVNKFKNSDLEKLRKWNKKELVEILKMLGMCMAEKCGI